MTIYQIGQRVCDRDYGDGEVYSLLHDRVWVKFDSGAEDRCYSKYIADTMLTGVTPPFTFTAKPSLRTLVEAMSKCRDATKCEVCVAFGACEGARCIPAFERKLVALALLEEATR